MERVCGGGCRAMSQQNDVGMAMDLKLTPAAKSAAALVALAAIPAIATRLTRPLPRGRSIRDTSRHAPNRIDQVPGTRCNPPVGFVQLVLRMGIHVF
jgi:hypothetical protein